MLRSLQYIIIIFLAVTLASCANRHKSTGELSGVVGAQGAGLGIEPQFDSNLSPEQQKLLAQKTVLFGFDQTDVQSSYVPMVQAHANYLQTHMQQHVLLAGNTDSLGSREYNMGLGERRAQSVATILMANGVLANQIVKVSYGPEVPVACGNSEDTYAQNRRVDILYCETTTCQDLAKKYAQHKMCSTHN